MECPNCKNNEKFSTLDINSGNGYTSIIIGNSGKVYPIVCLECGTIFINKAKLKYVKTREG